MLLHIPDRIVQAMVVELPLVLVLLEFPQVLDRVPEMLVFVAVIPGPRGCPINVGNNPVYNGAAPVTPIATPVIRAIVRAPAIVRIVPVVAIIAGAGKPVLCIRADGDKKNPAGQDQAVKNTSHRRTLSKHSDVAGRGERYEWCKYLALNALHEARESADVERRQDLRACRLVRCSWTSMTRTCPGRAATAKRVRTGIESQVTPVHMKRTIPLVCLTIFLAAGSPIREAGQPKNEGAVGAEEGPAWDGKGNLYFTGRNRIMRRDSTGKVRVFREPSGGANGLLFDFDGRLVICESANRRVLSPRAGRAFDRAGGPL